MKNKTVLEECKVKEGWDLGKCHNVSINGLLICFIKILHAKIIRSQLFCWEECCYVVQEVFGQKCEAILRESGVDFGQRTRAVL